LLSSVVKLMRDEGYTVSNLDCIIIAQEPKLSPYMSEMISNISRTLKIPPGDVNVKATTTEFLGFEGKREGIAAYAVVLLKRF